MNDRWVTRAAQIVFGALTLVLAAAACSEDGSDLQDAEIPEAHTVLPDAAKLATIQETCDATFGPGADALAAIDHDDIGYCLGPVALTGEGIDSAKAMETELAGWQVAPVFSEEGIAAFNVAARTCFMGTDACPTQQMAITVDGFVESAPAIAAQAFEADQIVISGNQPQAEWEWMAAQMAGRQADASESHPVEIRPVLLLFRP